MKRFIPAYLIILRATNVQQFISVLHVDTTQWNAIFGLLFILACLVRKLWAMARVIYEKFTISL